MSASAKDSAPLLRASHLNKVYRRRRGFFGAGETVQALRDVSLDIPRGGNVGLIGGSGSGKSTLARVLASLEAPDSGSVSFDGTELINLSSAELRPFRTQIQLVFQSASAAFNPHFSALAAVEEPLLIAGRHGRVERDKLAMDCIERVGIPRTAMHRNVLDFSGGQRQRLGIARALISRPRFLILDEALSGLDLSVQAQIANLLLEVQELEQLTYLWISHDWGFLREITTHAAVMENGQIIAQGLTTEVIAATHRTPMVPA